MAVGHVLQDDVVAAALEGAQESLDGAAGRVLSVEIDGGRVDAPSPVLHDEHQLLTLRPAHRGRDDRRRRRALEGFAELARVVGVFGDHPAEGLGRDAAAGFAREELVGVVGARLFERAGIRAKHALRIFGLRGPTTE